MISAPRHDRDYPDREIDCQEAMEPGFQAVVDCMREAGWQRGEVMRSLRGRGRVGVCASNDPGRKMIIRVGGLFQTLGPCVRRMAVGRVGQIARELVL